MKNFFAFLKTFFRNTGEKIQATHPFLQIVSFLVCLGIVCLLFIFVLFHQWTERSLFCFPNVNGKGISTEIRYIPHVHGTDARLSAYVSELLLGPGAPGLLPLYSRETSVRDAFIRKGVAYIDLSSEALAPHAVPIDPNRAYELFKKNVCTNFRNVDKLYLYIDGIEVYSRNPFAEADDTNKKR